MKRSNLQRGVTLQYSMLVLPCLLVFTVGLILPIILSFGFSFTDWDGLSRGKSFVGLGNYRKIFRDAYVGDAWLFTIEFTVLNTAIQNVFALIFALALDSSIKGKKALRTVLFMPCLISAIVTGFIWRRMFTNILPLVGEALGLKMDFLLLGKGSTVLSGLLIANNWQWIGYWMLIYLAALQSVPQELYEAAKVDGASGVRRFWSVTLPMLAPAITICVVGITTGSLKVYDLLVSSTGGGPGRASTSIIYLIYNVALGGRQYGYGSALSMTLIACLLLVAVIQLGVLKKREVQM